MEKAIETVKNYFVEWWNMSAEEYGMLVDGKTGMIIVGVVLVGIIVVCANKKIRNLFF